MSRLLVHVNAAARELGVIAPSIGIISGVRVSKEYPPEYSSKLDAILHSVGDGHSSSEGYREVFSRMGYDAVVPAGERLLNSFLKSGLKRINNLVDAYNAVALKYVAGIGLHDVARIDGEMKIERANGSQKIVPLFQNSARSIPQGDLVYSSQDRVIAWLGKRDVDSDEFKITDETSQVMVVVLGNRLTPNAMTKAMVHEIFDLVSLSCPSATVEFQEVVHTS
jgi:DNA/RNA-binding domain of Phe-tRNA-synthetase-like protein